MSSAGEILLEVFPSLYASRIALAPWRSTCLASNDRFRCECLAVIGVAKAPRGATWTNQLVDAIFINILYQLALRI